MARDSGWGVVAEGAGVVLAVDSARVLVRPDPPAPGGPAPAPRAYPLRPPGRSPQGTSRRQRPLVARGGRVAPGDLLAEGSAMAGGELALGQNLVGERVVREDLLTSDHLAEYRCPVRRTALGSEWVTPLVPGVRPARLAHLDGTGLVRVGQRVGPGDYLVGKAIPLPDDALTPAERLAHAILAPDGIAPRARDGSLLLPHGIHGVVVAVERLDAAGADLPPEVREEIRVVVATRRPVEPGDKLAGRHGNKGTISRIVPIGDMPFLPDGTPIDVILNPLGVPSRMNLGQLFEMALGWIANTTGARYAVPAYGGPGRDALRALLVAHGLPPDGKAVLRDGRTGEPFAQRVVVGVMYLLKLDHLAAKKAHARATGPYTALSGQPVGGKARFGGQRLGEMEVWALEAYGATELLRELLTLRSDDADGRLALHRHLTGAGPAPVAGGPTASLRRFRETVAALGVRVTPGPGAGEDDEGTGGG